LSYAEKRSIHNRGYTSQWLKIIKVNDKMRIVSIAVAVMFIGIIISLGILLPQQAFAIEGPQAIPTSAGVPPTRTTVARTAVINLGGYKRTQTAIALASATVTMTPIETASPTPTLTTVITATALPIPTKILKPQRLPDTGNVASSDIWYSTSVLGLIGICLLVSIGLYWQSKRPVK